MILFVLFVWLAPEAAPSPHGSPTQCAACHALPAEGSAPEAIAFAGGSADSACRSCHDADPHAVGLVPEKAQVPPMMTLVAGKLACLTCHDEPACEGHGVESKDFLRGGPYGSVGELCARCHETTALDRFDPHAAMVAAPADRHVCEHCHQEAPDPNASVADLKVSGPNTCEGCHAQTRHAGLDGHLGPVRAESIAAARSSGLPLADGDAIVCLTCHDPHPPSATARASERAAIVGRAIVSPAWEKEVLVPAIAERSDTVNTALEPVTREPALLRRSLADGALCGACHTAEAIDAARSTP